MLFRKPDNGRIGLLAGCGELPIVFAEAAASLKKEVVVFGVKGHTDRRAEAFAASAHYLDFGSLGDLPKLLKEEKIKRVVMAGGLPKKELYNPSTRLDPTAQALIGNTSNRGDDHLLRAFELFLRVKCGVRVIDSRSFLKALLAPKGVLTKRAPTEAEWKDLRFGRRIAQAIGKMDIGQTVVVKQGVVLAVEALEGTDNAIRRAGELAKEGAVVVKVCKPNQDVRFDLPCVGVRTLESMQAAGARVLALDAGKTLMLSRDAVLAKADSLNLTLVGL